MIPGKATAEGTAAYATRAGARAAHRRTALGLTLSSVGMGTYLGSGDARDDERYASAARLAVRSGINVIDSAINYRFQRSERSIGAALRKIVDDGTASREGVLVCTKGGFVPGDGGPPTQPWFESTFVKPGIVRPEDVVADCHCMTPAYLKHQVDQSRRNLGVETIDLYYVHNPETQLSQVDMDDFYRRLTRAFEALEECAAEGKIQWYGTATWDAYRVPPEHESHVLLERVFACARKAGGDGHRFRAIQLPFNIGMSEAMSESTQMFDGLAMTPLRAAMELKLAVFTSVPLLQGRLLGRLPPDLQARFPGLDTDAQRCIQFARSAPGVTAPLCGMKKAEHVEENAKLLSVAPLSDDGFAALFQGE